MLNSSRSSHNRPLLFLLMIEVASQMPRRDKGWCPKWRAAYPASPTYPTTSLRRGCLIIAHPRLLIEVFTAISDVEQRFPLTLPSAVWHPPSWSRQTGRLLLRKTQPYSELLRGAGCRISTPAGLSQGAKWDCLARVLWQSLFCRVLPVELLSLRRSS